MCSNSSQSLFSNCKTFVINQFSVSCLGEACDTVDDCKGNSPEVDCIIGICVCAANYIATNDGQCIARKHSLNES